MAKIKLPRYTMQTLTGPTVVSEAGSRLPIPDQRTLTLMTPAQQQAIGLLAAAPPRQAQVYQAGSVVITSVDDGSVRVLSASQYSVVFESAPEGGGKVRASTATLTQTAVNNGLAISTNSDGTINTGGPGDSVMTNPSTGEIRVVKRVDAVNNFEST